MEDHYLSPREFMRVRRPERFSDSIVEDKSSLDRSLLEYHIDTLSSRNQHTEFERFAKRLAEHEICPNLLPQTGPTGGGDSKVDSETYPVADALSLGWYVGIGREAASDRWGFAFSIKKDWRPKVRSDIKKIADTKRGYVKAFFVSNQFIRDRVRADIEDELSKKYGLDVRILDRSWILDKVFNNHHEALAIKELGLETAVRKVVKKGPLDFQREQDLEAIENKIKDALEQKRFGLSLVEDCIEAAEISRGLERPRSEVDGQFQRAERIAKKYGTKHQHLLSVYHRAWTVYWWYEDYDLFVELYNATEQIAKDSYNIYNLELLQNLWYLLFTSVRHEKLDRDAISFSEHTSTLAAALNRLIKNQNSPSSALQARTLLLLQRLALSIQRDPAPVLSELKEVVHECEGLVGYPLEPLVNILLEIGSAIDDFPEYNELFEILILVTSMREGEVSAARMLLKRGSQQLNAERPYDAISYLGRALNRLYKHESRDDLIRALILCSCAYESVGLLWAARGTVLNAASVASMDLWTYSHVSSLQAKCNKMIKWHELQIGRLPQILAWHELDMMMTRILVDKGYDPKKLATGEKDFDAILGNLLLRTDIWQLKQLTTLPDVLSKLDLHAASFALQYALGDEEELTNEVIGDEYETPYNFFKELRDHPSSKLLPSKPMICEGIKLAFESTVLGCQITAECENISPCIEIAESILSALESLLSTSVTKHMIAREPYMAIKILKGDFVEPPFGFKVMDVDGRPLVEVRCVTFDPFNLSRDEQNEIKDRLLKLLFDILARVFIVGNIEDTLQELFGDELAIERAINFTSSFITLGNVLGASPKTSIDAWRNSGAQEYPLLRREEWDAVDRMTMWKSSLEIPQLRPKITKEKTPKDLSDPAMVMHTQMETVSLIRETLWEKAGWSGTAFLWVPGKETPPIIAPMFRDGEAAGQIFALWRKELGDRDTEERLRITIIRGISKKNPYAYTVVIGSNPKALPLEDDKRLLAVVGRLNTMEPTSDTNLNTFLSQYEAFGGYLVAHAILRDKSSEPFPVFEPNIYKQELYVRDAWEIGNHDIDSIGIRINDDPIIPPGKDDAPVLELLRSRRRKYKHH